MEDAPACGDTSSPGVSGGSPVVGWLLLAGDWNRDRVGRGSVLATVGGDARGARPGGSPGSRSRVAFALAPQTGSALAAGRRRLRDPDAALARSLARREVVRGRFVARDTDAGGEERARPRAGRCSSRASARTPTSSTSTRSGDRSSCTTSSPTRLRAACVNAFLIAALALLAGFVPLGLVCLLAREIDGVVALQLCGSLTTLCCLPRRGLPPLLVLQRADRLRRHDLGRRSRLRALLRAVRPR